MPGVKRTIQSRTRFSLLEQQSPSQNGHQPVPQPSALFHVVSIDRLIQPLVIQAAAHRKKGFAKLAGVCRDFVFCEGSLSAPYLDQRQMIGPAALLQYVVAQDTGILRAVGAQLLDRGKALI